jgi:hypothetical protein
MLAERNELEVYKSTEFGIRYDYDRIIAPDLAFCYTVIHSHVFYFVGDSCVCH